MSSGFILISVSGEVSPKNITLADFPASFTACSCVLLEPAHSITQSTFLVYSLSIFSISSFIGSITRSAPSSKASSLFSFTGSDTISFAAPESLASWSIITPIGPAPITSTVLPCFISQRSIPCMQQDIGSAIAAVIRSIFSGNL